MRSLVASIQRVHRKTAVALALAAATAAASSPASGESAAALRESAGRAIAMHGAPALPAGFAHFPYVNPDAPKGGVLRLGERGSFDSLNPYIVRGGWPWMYKEQVFESLLARSYDEPFTLYGLLAERVSTPDDRSSVTFWLNPKARFSNGAPVTVDDVVWTLETLRDEGRPYFGSVYGQVARIERLGETGVRMVFKKPNRELPLLLGLMPVLSKAAFAGRDFSQPSAEPIVGSGPYVLDAVDMGRRVRLKRNPDYWGADLPVNRGRHNVDAIEVLYFRDGEAMWEAFVAGDIDLYAESDPARWADRYDFPRAASGAVVKSEIANGRPSGMRGFVFNTRRPIFADRRVREALSLALDYAWINQRFFAGQMTRITSYFSGSALGFRDPIDPKARALLAPFADRLPEGALEAGWRPSAGAGDGVNRRNLRKARRLLQEAGWRVSDGALRNADGEAFSFEILLATNADARVADAFADMLKPLGIDARRRLVDSAQHQERLTGYDFDMIVRRWALSLSPGEEQRFYWGSSGRDTPGSRNYMGAADPAVDAMIDALLAARSREDFVSAARALDRALSSGIYVLPLGYLETQRVAHASRLKRPAKNALYGFWPDVWPDAWWIAPE